MLKDERLEKIECLVNERKYVAISDLMLELSISKATVRRDLELLSEGGKLAITRGGAVSVSGGTTYELPYLEKKKVNHEEKIRIAHFAAALVKPGETILIDAGTTCIEMVPFLRERGNIMVATNDLMIALELGRCPNIETILIGGVLRKDFNTTSGYYAAKMVDEFHVDKAFISLDAIDLEGGCMITNMDEVAVKREIIASADEVIALCDHTKFSTKSFVGVCPMNKIDQIITGKELPERIQEKFKEAGKLLELI